MAPNVGIGAQGPVQRGWGLWLTSVVSVVVAALFVLARILQRLFKTTGLGPDDYTIIAALITSGILSLTECQAVVYGYGRKFATLPIETRVIARKWFYGANIVYKVVLMFNKMSIVCLYYRIFSVSSRSFRVACHVMNGFIITSGLAFVLATVFQCQPVAAFWDRSIPGAKCFKNEPWWISYATTQITQDFMLMFLPVRQIVSLSMTRTEKIGLSLVFCTGSFVTFTSIYRATTIATSAGSDPTWDPIPATIWSVIEANAGIICACLPMLRHPFVRLFGPLFGSKLGRSKQQSYHLTDRSHPRSGGLGSGKHGVLDTFTDFERESEERIMGIGQGTTTGGRSTPEQGGGIVIKNEFSVTRSESQDSKKGLEGSHDTEKGLAVLNDDKNTTGSGRSTYMHV
ncbi:hypothetical protein BS50DRAFT_589803 [Corynespora cassiicola Philippines]|uniref:Rhodopsin domain-containing protein n=1 Tax=Corynespora cassiicola Philippines TaxID=1448308 RepID=A0A2T2NIY6_CORCC|nr:hypothetical protein BS50DRAFT_589803 [Corynespora cassiicola Philippines]